MQFADPYQHYCHCDAAYDTDLLGLAVADRIDLPAGLDGPQCLYSYWHHLFISFAETVCPSG